MTKAFSANIFGYSNKAEITASIAAVKIAYIAIFGIENEASVPFTNLTSEIQTKKPKTWRRFVRLAEVEAQNGNFDESYVTKAARVNEKAAIERAEGLARQSAK